MAKKGKPASFLLISILFLATLWNSSSVQAADGPTVSIHASKQVLAVNDTFDVSIRLSGFSGANYGDVNGFQFVVSYDPEMVEPLKDDMGKEKWELGGILTSLKDSDYVVAANRFENGQIIFGAALYEQATPFNGEGTLYISHFKVKKEGTIRFTFVQDKTIFTRKGHPGIAMQGVTQADLGISSTSSPGGAPPSGGTPPPPAGGETPPIGGTIPSPASGGGPSTTSPSDSAGGNNGVLRVEEFKDYERLKEISWAFSAIERLVWLGVINGENGEFKPEKEMTREQFAKVIVLTLKLELTTGLTTPFSDVAEGRWSKDYVAVAASHQLIQGKMVNGRLLFVPTAPITRAEIAAILVRALHLDEGTEKPSSPFTDVGSHWAKKEIALAYQAGLLKGRDETHFAPDATATRAEVAVLLSRLLDYKETH